jgi:hypothetical protein
MLVVVSMAVEGPTSAQRNRVERVAKAGGGRRTWRSRHGVEDLVAQRRKLLRLYYDDKIGADLFAEEEARLSVAIREAQREADDARVEVAQVRELVEGLGEFATVLTTADPKLKTKLYDEFGISVTYDPTRRTARIESRPETPWARVSVGGGTPTNPDWRIQSWVGG